MATATKKSKIDWVIPMNNDRKPTLEEYRAHIAEAERSGFMSHDEFAKRQVEWQLENL